MLIQNYHIDNNISPFKTKTAEKNKFLTKSPYLQRRTDHNKYKQYLPRLSTKIKYRIDDPELTKLSLTKPNTSQSSKICRTQVSQQSKIHSTMYSQKHKIQFTKTKKSQSNKLWHPSISYEKQPKSFNVTNAMNKIPYDDKSLHETNHQTDSKFMTCYQQHDISHNEELQQFQNTHHFRTQTFQQNIIRNRLKIKSSMQVQQQNRLNCTFLVKNKQRYKTQLHQLHDTRDNMGPLRLDTHQLNDTRDNMGPSRLDNQSDFRVKNIPKKSISIKQPDFSKLKQKNKKTNLYVPSFNNSKLNTFVIQNLLKKAQLQSQIIKYQTQTFGKQILFKIPEENHKLQRQIEKIQVYFSKNKKGWFSQQLQKILEHQSQKLKNTQGFSNSKEMSRSEKRVSNSKEMSRSEKIGKIVRQVRNPMFEKFEKKKQTQSMYSDDRFEGEGRESVGEDGETVVLHDNSYRKEVIQIDSSTQRNQTRIHGQSKNRLSRVASDELIVVNTEDKLVKGEKRIEMNGQQLRIPINERVKSTESGKQRNSSNRVKRKSEKRQQCVIF